MIASISVIFSLELLTLIPLLIIAGWFSIPSDKSKIVKDAVNSSPRRIIIEITELLGVLVITASIIFILIFILSGFNVIESYYKSMTIHGILEARRPYLKWIWANPIEFFLYLSIPVFALLVSKAIWQFRSWMSQGTSTKEPLLVAFLVTFILMDLSGINRGEVARLWMFLGPIISLIVADAIRFLGDRTRWPNDVMLSFVFILLIFLYTVSLREALIPLPLGFPLLIQ